MSDNKGGRPTSYKEEYNELAYKFCLLGCTDERLAKLLEVAVSTINKWKLEHPRFSESIKRGKDIADAEVASSLYKRATGYSHKEVKVFNNQGKIVTHDVVKQYPPDTTAIAYWLNNRQRGDWAQRQSIETKDTTEDVSDSDLDERISKLMEKASK